MLVVYLVSLIMLGLMTSRWNWNWTQPKVLIVSFLFQLHCTYSIRHLPKSWTN